MTNRNAFWDVVAFSEIGPAMLALSDDGYNVLVGSTPDHMLTFSDYSKHPQIHNVATNSDAAGRGQFMGRYWLAYQRQLGLPDFGHDSQYRWFIQLVMECHALDDVDAGRIESAIVKCNSRWASFPGAGYGQHENNMQSLIDHYRDQGGTLA